MTLRSSARLRVELLTICTTPWIGTTMAGSMSAAITATSVTPPPMPMTAEMMVVTSTVGARMDSIARS